MTSPAAPMQKISMVPPDKRMEANSHVVSSILRLPGGKRVITRVFGDSSLRVWDLESGAQVGEVWTDEGSGPVRSIALSPGGKTIASGSEDGAVRLWDIDTGKVIKKWTGHTNWVQSVCWSPDGQRVVSGSLDDTIRVWDVQNGETVLILATLTSKKRTDHVWPVCSYSPDGEMIATDGAQYGLKIWDANTGELLNTLHGGFHRWKFDTATCQWQIEFLKLERWDSHIDDSINVISLSPNERILASVSGLEQTVQLWNFANNQPIGPPLHHDGYAACATFSSDGKLLVTGCNDGYMYIWDASAIVSEADLGDLLLETEENTVNKVSLNSSTTCGVPSDGRRGYHTASPRQWLLSRLPSLWRHRRSDTHGTTEPNARSQSRPPRSARNLIPDILRKRKGSDIQSRE